MITTAAPGTSTFYRSPNSIYQHELPNRVSDSNTTIARSRVLSTSDSEGIPDSRNRNE